MRRATWALGGLALMMSVAPRALAQTASSPASIDEVVVTAQRREQTLQDVPLAVNTFSGDEIADRGLTDVRDLAALSPGATFTFINAAEPVISLRGIASGGEGAASDSGVLMMIDGEVIARDFLRGAPVFDVERVEVLRGPQGTTYGRNATGGVFHVISRRPKNELGGDLSVTVGDYAHLRIDAAVEGPLGPKTAARFALHTDTRDGYSEDYFNGRDVDYRRVAAGRLTVTHDVTESLNLVVRAHYSEESHGETGPLKAYDPTRPFLAASRFAPAFTEPTTDPYRVGTSPQSYFDRTIGGASLELNWSGPVDVVALTTYRRGKNDYIQGAPAGLNPRGYNVVTGYNEADTVSQEIRVSDTILDDRLFWTAGLFYIREDIEFRYQRIGLSLVQDLDQGAISKSFGLFGELEWRPLDQLTVTLGLRYSADDKSFRVLNRATGPAAGFFVTEPGGLVTAKLSDSWEEPTGRLSVEYKWTPDISTYVTYAQGYKSGGFNAEPPTVAAANTPYDQETVQNIEVGLRARWLDRRLVTNVTLFDMTYEDIQTPFFVGGVEIIDNIGEASIKGVELEVLARPTSFLTLTAAYSRLDAKYDKFLDDDGTDLSGLRVARAPRWTFTGSATARTPVVVAGGYFEVRADYRTRSKVYNDVPPDEVFGIRPRTDQLDLRASWTAEDGDLEIAVWSRNVLDEAEMQYIGPQTGALAQRPVIYGPPRTVGATVKTRF